MAIGFLRLLTLRAQRPFLPCPIFHFQLTAALAMPSFRKKTLRQPSCCSN